MLIASAAELLRYFGARHWEALEQQFNTDGRQHPILLDEGDDGELGVFTAPQTDCEVLSTLTFPLHVSDFLGRIEIDQRLASAKGQQ